MKKRLIAMLIAMVMLVGTVTAYAEVQETTTFEGEDDDLSVQSSFGAKLLCKETGENDKKDRWLSFIDLGSGASIKEHPQELLSGKVGLGYRLSLSRTTKLDFIAAIRTVLTHPDIDYYGTMIEHARINRNNAYMSALSFSMALTF